MTVAINNPVSANVNNPCFKGSVRETEKGNKYYHSHAGLAIASGFAALCSLDVVGGLLSSHVSKGLPEEVKPILKYAGKSSIILGLAGMAIHLGCGTIIDKMRNKEARENADEGTAVITYNDGTQQPYVQLDTGSRKGAILGVAAGTINQLVRAGVSIRKPLPEAIVSVGFSALGGWLLGKWSDHIASRKSNENLDTIV